MAESKSKFESIREWVVDHKLRTVGCLWLSGIGGSIAYNWSQPNMKPSVKIIHARDVIAGDFVCEHRAPNLSILYSSWVINGCIAEWFIHLLEELGSIPQSPLPNIFLGLGLLLHAQALTLAALAGAAVVEYYDHRNKPKADPYAKYLPHSHKE
ncbi:hypothetical protein GOBAR_DD02999 [Gossypium barbadense]|nr:hypothetical protein GOBAR_DD02999 [Gossypium barbadense]